jgi:hypothetical protein
VEFVDQHREQFGVEPICAVLGCAASTYHAARTRPPSARQQRDERLKGEVLRVNAEYLASIKPGAPHVLGNDETTRAVEHVCAAVISAADADRPSSCRPR